MIVWFKVWGLPGWCCASRSVAVNASSAPLSYHPHARLLSCMWSYNSVVIFVRSGIAPAFSGGALGHPRIRV